MKSLPPRQTAQIQGCTLEYITSGSGSPAIVLVNGAGGPLEGWYRVYAELAAISTVFAYNRPGIGGSDRPNSPQTGDVIVTILRELLMTIGIVPPYILVGHSLGGLYVNLFARRFPGEVAGVVLLDAAAPGDEILQHTYQTTLQRGLNAVIGLFDPIFGRDKNREVAFVSETVNQLNNAGPFPDVPLIVVSGGKPISPVFMSAKALQIRRENQMALSALSRYGEQMIAARSGHFPQFSEPERVVRAIQQVHERAKQQARST